METSQVDANDDRVYVDLVRPADGSAGGVATASVTFRRTKGRDSLKRLSDILSAYIPVRGRDPPPHLQEPLLEEGQGDATPPQSPSRTAGYRILMLLDVAGLRLADFSSRENLLTAADADAEAATSAPVGGEIIGVALSKSGYAFLAFRDSPNLLRLEVHPREADTPVSKTCRLMQVRLRGGASLLPSDIKVHGERLFVCGRVERLVGDERVVNSVMVRCDLECNVELASKELPHPRFLGFDVDPADGQLVVASPTPDGQASQIFKMSADFKRKLFKIQLGSRNGTWNRPEHVACLGAPGQCWVAADQADTPSGLATGQVKHRLMSFPLRPPPPQAAESAAAAATAQQQQQSTKAWMKVSSWKFEGIRPGRLLAVPGHGSDQEDRLLMLSRDQGNIYCVSETLGCTPLTHPTSEGGQAFTALCCLQEPCARPGAQAIDILAATKDSLYLLQAS